MAIALIFAGGKGTRMSTNGIPKQFLEIDNKPIIIHTIEVFERHPLITEIFVVCIENYISILKKEIKNNKINKVSLITSGGKTGQESIFIGLHEIYNQCNKKDLVLIHDGVRPFIDEDLITENINCALENGNAITACKAVETFFLSESKSKIDTILKRDHCYIAKAPQTFIIEEIYQLYKKSFDEKYSLSVDSASLVRHYNKELFFVLCKSDNIKITTPEDFYIAKAILECRNALKIMGI